MFNLDAQYLAHGILNDMAYLMSLMADTTNAELLIYVCSHQQGGTCTMPLGQTNATREGRVSAVQSSKILTNKEVKDA